MRLDNDGPPQNLNQTYMYIVFQIASTVVHGVLVILFVFHAGVLGLIPVEGKIVSSSYFSVLFIYLF